MTISTIIKSGAAALFLVLSAFPALAQQPGAANAPDNLNALEQQLALNPVRLQEKLERIPDSSRLRANPAGTLPAGAANFRLTEGIAAVSLYKDQEFTDSVTGSRFRVMTRVLHNSDNLAVQITPVRPGETAEIQRGTWVLYRNRSTGLPERLRIYFSTDPELYISIRPDSGGQAGRTDDEIVKSGRTLVDMLVYGVYVRKDVPLGLSFLELYNVSLATIIQRTRQQIPWEYFDPDPINYRDIASASAVIREGLPTLVFYDDGAFDENGRPVFIKTGESQNLDLVRASAIPPQEKEAIRGGVNCSGFAKWVIDGIIRPKTGSGTLITRLKEQTAAPDTHFTRDYRDERDLFFALDWTRNLAAAVISMKNRATVFPGDAGIDVTFNPFSLFTTMPRAAPDAVNYSGYQVNVGYQARFLKPLLYALAITEPGTMYLGAISSEGGTPLLRSFYHIAIFLPRFDSAGSFHVDVFESAAETSLERFIALNPGVFVHLVRVKVPEQGFFRP